MFMIMSQISKFVDFTKTQNSRYLKKKKKTNYVFHREKNVLLETTILNPYEIRLIAKYSLHENLSLDRILQTLNKDSS